MGYEHRIYIVKAGSMYDPFHEKIYADILAKFNLGVNRDMDRMMDIYYHRETRLFIGEGDETIVVDEYGKPLIEIPVEDLLEDLQREYIEGDNLQLAMLRGALEMIVHDENYSDNIVCLHYGY